MKCKECDLEMEIAAFTSAVNKLPAYLVVKQEKRFWSSEKLSSVTCYVCPRCGHIDLYADEPQKLTKQ